MSFGCLRALPVASWHSSEVSGASIVSRASASWPESRELLDRHRSRGGRGSLARKQREEAAQQRREGSMARSDATSPSIALTLPPKING
jgi:hypothetical protein